MILRGGCWLLALVALGAALAGDRAPRDPVPMAMESASPGAATSVLVYHWADRDPGIGALEAAVPHGTFVQLDSRGEWRPRVPGTVRPAPRIVAYGSSAARTRAFAQALQFLALAERQELEEPVRIETELMFGRGAMPWIVPKGDGAFGATVLPMGTPGFAAQVGRIEIVWPRGELFPVSARLHFAGSKLVVGPKHARAWQEREWREDITRIWTKLGPQPGR